MRTRRKAPRKPLGERPARRGRSHDGAAGASAKHLVLVGGGHAHVHVLRMLAREASDDLRVTVVSPGPYAVYSGMIPGALVGLYPPHATRIDVAALAARAGATFLADRVVALAPQRRAIETAERGEIAYDILSLNLGSQPRDVEPLRARPNLVPVKPVEAAAERIGAFLAAARRGDVAPCAVVVGGGAAGVEVAFALRERLRGQAGAHVAILERAATVLPGMSPPSQRLVERLLGERGIELRTSAPSLSVDERGVDLGSGERLDATLVVWATGAEGLPLFAGSGLALDARGFVLVDAALRSTAFPEIFAAGDCASLLDHPATPRAGVFAVREAPILAHNLLVAARGRGRWRRYRPQSDFLALLSTADGRAVISYRGRAAHGRLWWRLKNWIDTRFIARHAPPDPELLRPPMQDPAAMEPCGGCAAKLDAASLARALRETRAASEPQVAIGLAAPDDAAVLHHGDGDDVVATVDAFPPFIADLYVTAEIAAVNAASDVFAMGGAPTAALALLAPPAGSTAVRDADLRMMLRGARRGLEAMGVPLVGGHTLQAGEPLVGFTILGRIARGAAMTKAGARAGEHLVLTKSLGTAVVLAAARAGECPAAWLEAALCSMRRPNGAAAAAFLAAGLRCCTDVSGFGLLGHLLEVLRASKVGAKLSLAQIPALPGAIELLRAGWRSSADGANRTHLAGARFAAGAMDEARLALLCDPQTSGGLLAAVPAERVADVLGALQRAGERAALIGELTDAEPGAIAIAP